MSNFACRVGACDTSATLALVVVVLQIGIGSFLFLYRALASMFSVFVEASVVVKVKSAVVNPEYKDYPACSYLPYLIVVLNIRVVIHYRLTSIDFCEGRK